MLSSSSQRASPLRKSRNPKGMLETKVDGTNVDEDANPKAEMLATWHKVRNPHSVRIHKGAQIIHDMSLRFVGGSLSHLQLITLRNACLLNHEVLNLKFRTQHGW